MGELARINEYILDKGFKFQVSPHDIDQGFKTVTVEGRKVWYTLKQNSDIIMCYFGDWRTGEKHSFTTADELTSDQAKEFHKFQKNVQNERREKALVAKALAEELWEKYQREKIDLNSDYLVKKRLKPSSDVCVVRGDSDNQLILVIPAYDEYGEIWNLQKIYRAAGKFFNKSAKTKGVYHLIKGTTDQVFVGEGYATCLSVHQVSGAQCYVAFSASNLEAVYKIAKAQHPSTSSATNHVHLIADFDGETFQRTGENTGMQAVQKIACTNKVKFVCPVDLEREINRPENVDFSDLWTNGKLGKLEIIAWEKLVKFIFKREAPSNKPKVEGEHVLKETKLKLLPTANVDNSDASDHKPIEIEVDEPKKIPVDCDPDDADFPSKPNGFFMQVPKLKADGTPSFGADGKPLVRSVPDFECYSRYLGRRFFLKTNDAFSYIYEQSYYRQASPLQLEHLTLNLVEKNTSPNLISSFARHARAHNFVRADELGEPKGKMNLKNGVLNVRTRKLEEHSPEYFFKYKLPHEYVAGAECPQWLSFLERVFEGNQELMDVCGEIFGYILLGGEPFLHKAFVLSGEGRNGKSTFLDVLKYIIGRSNYSSIPVGQLERPFSAIMADGMLANIVGETSTKEINSETFKTAVGGEELIAAHKGLPEYAMPFHARIVMACNKLPHLGDATTGAHEKFYILPFNKYFHEHERKASFAQYLLPEASGIINWALDGLDRLSKRGGLPQIGAVKEQALEMREETDSVFAWLQDNVVFDADSTQRIQFKEYYPRYKIWCESEGRNFVSANTFSKRIAAEMRKHPHCLTSHCGRVLTFVAGLRIRPQSLLGKGLDH